MTSTELRDIIKRAELLSPDEQLLLIAHLAETARQSYQAPTKRRTLDHALGLLATNKPAPTDAEMDQWLDEHRKEKHR
jgi:hypothetical protein